MILRTRWSATDILRLIELYPTHTYDELATLLNRTRDAVETKSSDLKLRKGRRDLATIRKRAQSKREPKQSGFLDSGAPDKPCTTPQKALRTVCYGRPVAAQGVPVNGDALARAVAHRG